MSKKIKKLAIKKTYYYYRESTLLRVQIPAKAKFAPLLNHCHI